MRLVAALLIALCLTPAHAYWQSRDSNNNHSIAAIAGPTISNVNPSSGPIAGGTSVVITGTGFTGVSAVKFGATNAASFVVNSTIQITAVSPAEAAGTVNITATTSVGTSPTSSADQFTFNAPPPANVPVVTGATFFETLPTSGVVGNLPVSNSPTSCAITGGNTGTFSASLVGGACQISTTALSNRGFADLIITAVNANGTSLPTMAQVQWRSWNTTTVDVIPASIIQVFPAATPATGLANGFIFGRVSSDSNAGAAYPTSCTVTGSSLFKGVQSTEGYNCLIEVTGPLPASGSATLSVALVNSVGTGTAATVPVSWSTISASAPVVSQAALKATTPVVSGTTIGTVNATNAPTSCTISGDPGNPIKYFSIAPQGNTCVIKANMGLTGSLGSPILYVTATNASGTSLGAYVVVALGPSSAPTGSSAAVTAALAAGYTDLILNDTSMATTQFDTNMSRQPSPTLHWFGDNANSPGNYFTCDGGGQSLTSSFCDYADIPNFFDRTVKDQSGDNIAGPGNTWAFSVTSGVVNLQAPAGALTPVSCGQFGKVPNNTQYPVIGHAYGPGFYMDYTLKMPGSIVGTAPEMAIWSVPLQGIQNALIPFQTNMVEVDFLESQFGDAYNFWLYNNRGFNGTTFGYHSGAIPTDSAMHHYQVLQVPSTQNSGTGFTKFFLDGALIGTITYTAQPGLALDTQFSCIKMSPSTAFAMQLGSFQIWQHP